jgi:hypothetical protein
MAHANWRLDNPPVVDVAVSRRMGLFVVARLAARHGIRVRLRPATTGGLIALVWLPDETITREIRGIPPGMPRSRPVTPEDLAAAGSAVGGTGVGPWADGRATREQRINAARAPRFAPLRPDMDGASPGPIRAAGPVPRTADTSPPTGPLPTFRADGPPLTAEPGAGVTGLQEERPTPSGGDGHQGTGSPAASPGVEANVLADSQTDQRQGSSPADGAYSRFGASPSPRGVIVPPPVDEALTERNRLPIYEAVESDWFRRGRRAVVRSGQGKEAGSGWASAADEGWRAAEAVSAPSSAGLTPAGLPKRVPQANLVPGAAPAPAVGGSLPAPAPARSAAATRDRFASYQRGVLRGRAAAEGVGSDGGEDENPR